MWERDCRSLRFLCLSCLLIMLASTVVPVTRATVLTEIIDPPALLQSADGRARFTLTEICHNWPTSPDAPFAHKHPINEAQYRLRCVDRAKVFVGEFSTRQDTGSWRTLWSMLLPDGFPTTNWLIDDQGHLLVVVWYDFADKNEKVLIFDRGGLRHVHDLKTILRKAGLPWEGQITNRSTWRGDVRFTESRLSLLIDMIPNSTAVYEQPGGSLQATLSLAEGRLSLIEPNKWASVRREMECRLLAAEAELHAANPEISWNKRGEGTMADNSLPVRIWNQIAATISAKFALTKARVLFKYGLPCHGAAGPPP